MTGTKYILTSTEFDGEIVFNYSLKGYLSGVEFVKVSRMSMRVFDWLWANLPTTSKQAEDYDKRAGNFSIKEVPADMSFERFWKEYGYKVGKKKMCENIWNRLSRADRMGALMYIEVLRNQKKRDGTQLPYPSTYLNQRYWEA